MKDQVAGCLEDLQMTATGFEARFLFPGMLPVFAGHFPEGALVPGVFLIEAVRLCAERAVGRPLRTLEVTEAKFSAPVLPDQGVVVTAQLESQEAAHRCRARVMRDDEVAGKFSLLLG